MEIGSNRRKPYQPCVRLTLAWLITVSTFLVGSPVFAQSNGGCYATIPNASGCPTEPCDVFLPAADHLRIRVPQSLRPSNYAEDERPLTVSDFDTADALPRRLLSLDDAISSTLENGEVVRILSGVSANTSGRTIYDVAVSSTNIDVARSSFDPTLSVEQSFTNDSTRRLLLPSPSVAAIAAGTQDQYSLDLNLSKRNLLGGTSSLRVTASRSDVEPVAQPADDLNPTSGSQVSLGYNQPFLRGAGKQVNQAPIVIARLGTEQTFFSYKETVQQSVLSVISGYWNLVFARTVLWAAQQQVDQAQFAYEQARARFDSGDANAGELAQAELALEGFKATLVGSQANVITAQGALLNVIGAPPHQRQQLVPVTPLIESKVDFDWRSINQLGQTVQPAIVQLKLVLDADIQQRLIDDNQVRPQLDGIAQYRFNGSRGTIPLTGFEVGDDFGGWTLGVDFSVPIGYREARANLRQRDLIITRDRANLAQAYHQLEHDLALVLRNIDLNYLQYQRFLDVREAAARNLEVQLAAYRAGNVQFIVVLQAITSWGSSIQSVAQALTQYNIQLATLQNTVGTILEDHDVVFFEERFRTIGPLGRCGQEACYPFSTPTSKSALVYDAGMIASEENFDLRDPVEGALDLLEPPSNLEDADLDMPTEFMRPNEDKGLEETIDPFDDGELTDEEINEILSGRRSSWRFIDWLRLRR